jgi:hypothetical protein
MIPMTKPIMDLKEFLDKSGDADLLRETERLMELGVGGRTGAAYAEKTPNAWRSGTAAATGIGGRAPGMSSCASRSSARCPDSCRSSIPPRRAVEKALTAVIQKTCVHGVSTRAMDDLAQAMGGTGISRSGVGRLREEVDERVDAFLTRPIGGGPASGSTPPATRSGRAGASCSSPSPSRSA